MLYENYTVEDLVLDKSFQKYCLGSNDEAVQFWNEWIKSHPQKSDEIEQARQLYFILNGNNTNDHFAAHEEKFINTVSALINFSGENKTNYSKRSNGIIKKLFSQKIITISAAAAIIIIISGVIFFTQNAKHKDPGSFSQIIASAQSEHKVIRLPDGSKVILNEKSTIQLEAGFNDKSRKLSLSGEAFFDVAHNASKPFIIHTQYIDIKVLGTVFNVKAYPNEKFAEASLLKGSVELTLNKAHNKKIILKPNEKISFNYTSDNNVESEKAVSKSNLNISQSQSDNLKDSAIAALIWNKGNLLFDNKSFEDIAIQLENWFDVTILFREEETKQYRFTGDFGDKTIIQILNALQLSRHFNYEIQDNSKIIISK